MQHCEKSLENFGKLWRSYLDHCRENHNGCIGLASEPPVYKSNNMGPQLNDEEEKFLGHFLSRYPEADKIPQLVQFTASYPNESIWNVMELYRDKTIHYKYYDLLYQMGFLDWNENRLREVSRTYQTKVRAWKTRHKKHYNRKILEKKTYLWQEEALIQIFPNKEEFFK